MKRGYAFVLLLSLALLISWSVAVRAGDFDGIKEVKVVWDVHSGDEKVFTDRMKLIQETADSLSKKGLTPMFVIGIRGPATKFVTKSTEGTKFEKDKIEKKEDIQSMLHKMTEGGIKIKQCSIPMKRFDVAKDNIAGFVEVVDNIWENMAVLQNKGYAYIVP